MVSNGLFNQSINHYTDLEEGEGLVHAGRQHHLGRRVELHRLQLTLKIKTEKIHGNEVPTELTI